MSNDITLQIVPEGKIRDYIDGTIRKDTPEEYVRQTVEKRLVIEHKYPKERIAVEYPIKMGDGKKRADIVIFSEKSTANELQDQATRRYYQVKQWLRDRPGGATARYAQ